LDKKTVIAVAIAAAVTLLVTQTLSYFTSSVGQGQNAAEKVRVTAIVKEMLITDSGLTHSAALKQINDSVISIGTKVEGIQREVDTIDRVIQVLIAD